MLIDQIKDDKHIEEEVFDAIKASHLPVVLFGAGRMAQHVLSYVRHHGIEPLCICDNNPAKQGTSHLGLSVCRYEQLKDRLAANGGKYNIVVSVGPELKNEVFSQLAEAHEENPVWYLQGYELCGAKLDYAYVCAHTAQFEAAYSSLADDFSRKVFTNVLNAKISGNADLYMQIMAGTQYFDSDVVRLTDHEVFLDVGAYRGDAIVEFARRNGGKYEAVIALEPDKETFAMLKTAISAHGILKTELYNRGAWNRRGTLQFHGGYEESSCISSLADESFATSSIAVDRIDDLLHGRRVTYVALDIEGAERQAILGAEQTIRRWKPKMAVSVYHRREDLFDLLLLIKSLVPDYKFFMRHYMCDQTETILYAVYGT